jgi:hypothetical protein
MERKSVHEDTAAVVPLNNQLPAELLGLAKQDAGKGISFKSEDNEFPLVYVLQTGSPVCNKRSLEYLSGAEAGHFWFRNALDPIRSGIEGIDVIPCWMEHKHLEFRPNRGGYVTEHDHEPADAVWKTVHDDDGRSREVLVRANGNVIEHARQFFLLVDGVPYVLSCKSTQHKFARRWNSYFKQLRHPETGDALPSYIHRYRLTTAPDKNEKGDWFGLRFADLGPVTVPEYMAGKQLNQIVESGAARAAAPINDSAE